MSYSHILKSVVLFWITACTSYPQFYSELQYELNTSVEVQSGADVCADDIIILGTYSGTGTICLGALPVTLSSFTSVVNKNNVILSWSTVLELNNAGFEIQRKINIDSAIWKKAGFVNGFGSTNEPKNYTFTDNSLQTGTYLYRLKQIDYNGNFEYFPLNGEIVISMPIGFSLGQNYPNPSNPKSKIDFHIPTAGKINITVYNLIGQVITQLVNEFKEPGHYSVEFDGSSYPSGTYIYKITGEGFTDVKKMILVK
jgi:uncharacterized protein YdaL